MKTTNDTSAGPVRLHAQTVCSSLSVFLLSLLPSSSLSLSPSPGPHACAVCAGDSVVSQPGLSSPALLIFSATHKAFPGICRELAEGTRAQPTLSLCVFSEKDHISHRYLTSHLLSSLLCTTFPLKQRLESPQGLRTRVPPPFQSASCHTEAPG